MSASSCSLMSLSGGGMSTRRKSRKSPKRQVEDDLKEIERRKEAYFADPYRLTKPVVSQKEWGDKRQNDSKNPNNVYGLGEFKQGIWKSNRQLQKLLGGSPVELIRNEWKEPAGLLNHGATCYVSSLLQCWFFMPVLRSAVFQYDDGDERSTDVVERNSSAAASSDSVACSSQDSVRAADGQDSASTQEPPDTPDGGSFGQQTTNASLGKQMRYLQELFARMQLHCGAYFRTEPLMRSLSLSLSVQQDVQEFNKLLLAHLSKTFKTSSRKNVQQIVENVFEGATLWETKCCECHFASQRDETFLELSVPLHNKDSLQDSLNSLFNPEYLTDDNAYMCPQCNKKCEAVRQQKVNRAPPVLNLQLLRFVYDLQTLTKKKLRHQVDFSAELSLPTTSGTASYALTAVVHHHGDSPYSGHYTVDVWDSSRQRWWEIDDETVNALEREKDVPSGTSRRCVLPGIHSKDEFEVGTLVDEIKQMESDKVSLLQRPRPYPEQSKSSNKKKTAYMLVYSRIEDTQQFDALLPERISPRRTLRSGIKRAVSRFHGALQASLERRIRFWYDVFLRREMYRKLFIEGTPVPTNGVDPHLLSASSKSQCWRWIPVEWLRNWVVGMLDRQSSGKNAWQHNGNKGSSSQELIELDIEKDEEKEKNNNSADAAHASETRNTDTKPEDGDQDDEAVNLNVDPDLAHIDNALDNVSLFSGRLDPRTCLEGYCQPMQHSSTWAISPDSIVILKRLHTQSYDYLFSPNVSAILGEEGTKSLKEQAESQVLQDSSRHRSRSLEAFLSTVRQAQTEQDLVRSATVTQCTHVPEVLVSQESCFNSRIYHQWKSATQRIFDVTRKCRELAQMLEEDSCRSPPEPGTVEYDDAQREAAGLLEKGHSEGGIVRDSRFDVWTLSSASYRTILQLSKTLLHQSDEDKLLDFLVRDVRQLVQRRNAPLESHVMETLLERLAQCTNLSMSTLRPVNEDIQCTHKLIRPGKKAWRLVSGRTWRAITELFNSICFRVVPGESLTCTTCREQKDFIREEQEADREMRDEEIRPALLQRLWKRKKGHPPTTENHGLLLPISTGSYFLVSRSWLQEWRGYVSGTYSNRPEAVNLWNGLVPSEEFQEYFRNNVACDSRLQTISIPSHLMRFLSDCVRLDPASILRAYSTNVSDKTELAKYIPADGAENTLLREEEEGKVSNVELVPVDEFLELCRLYNFPYFSEETEPALGRIRNCSMHSTEYSAAVEKLPAPIMHFLPSDRVEPEVIDRRLSSNTDAHESNANYSIVFDPPLNPYKLDEDIRRESENLYEFDSGTIHVHFLRSAMSNVPSEARNDRARNGSGRKRLRKQDQSEAVPIQNEDTIQLLKMKIMQMFGTETLGSLFYQGNELLDFETVKGCGVPNGGHLFWRPNDQRVREDQLADKLAESKAYSEQEVGFSGSALQG
eukprot:gb/GECG01016452.1/.p1 GENE.gb/GECG01016452.1/~~gb/GECG01016452.1/.p1  ORF type:complete len:1429 (+),score=205.54 gb/GECG01016452.1/:1-4287(+)